MLNPPGSSGARTVRATNRRKTPESTEDQLRQLQRTGSNKKCCDCSTKLPQCVNLTVGSFVCLACSGMHRELNMRVKGIGASTFSQEEVDRLKATSNDAVNQAYMARYNPNVERIQPPTNNFDQAQLRDWIKRKYRDKVWYSVEPQPTRVQIPPKTKSTPAPAAAPSPQDLLGFGSQAPPAQSANNQQWDAFGGSSTNNQSNAFPADFGSSQSKQQQPPQTQDSFANFGAQQQQPAPQQQGFANFGAQQQQPQSSVPQQQGFANFGAQQQPQQPMPQQQGFANFGAQNHQQQTQPPMPPQQQAFANFGAQNQQQQTQQPQQPIPQQQGFANFGAQNQQQQPVSQQQQSVPTQQGFANFGGTDQSGVQQPPQQQFGNFSQQTSPHQQPPQQSFANYGQQPQQGQFAAFGQNQQQPGMTQQAQAPPPQQQPQLAGAQHQGFANFGGQQQHGIQQIPQQNFGNFQNGNPPQQNKFGAFGQPQQQPGMPQEAPAAPPQHQNGFGQNVQQTPSPQIPVQSGIPSQASKQTGSGDMPSNQMTPAAIGGMSVDDAFSDFSINANTPKSLPAASSAPTAPPVVKKGEDAKYAAGATAVYTNSNGAKEIIKILKVHLDDELVPFYTIQLPDGREKQTDDGHLSDLVDSAEASEIKNLLIGLSNEQLQKVVAFIKDLKNGANLSMSLPSMSSAPAPVEHASSDPFAGMAPSPSLATPSAPMPSMPAPMPPVSPSPVMPPAAPQMPPSVSPVPPQLSNQPPASVSQSMGQMPTSAPHGMMGKQDAFSMIPSPTPNSQQLQTGNLGDLPSPPVYQQQGMPPAQQGFNQQQAMMPNPNQQQMHAQGMQHMQHMQHMQNQQQYMQQQQPQGVQTQQPQTQQYMQQQAVAHPQQQNTGDQEKGNPFDMY